MTLSTAAVVWLNAPVQLVPELLLLLLLLCTALYADDPNQSTVWSIPAVSLTSATLSFIFM